MKLNGTRNYPSDCIPPLLPTGLCGPEHLAELLIASRKFHPEWSGPISDDGLRKLLDLVFFASLMPEEGHFPRYKIVCQSAEGSSFLVTRIDSIKIDDVNQIRRLGPACTHSDCALLVAEREGSIWCEGVMNVGAMGYATWQGYPSVIPVGGDPQLLFEVFGPGHLRCSESCYGGFEIRAGRIRALSAYDGPKPVKRLLDTLQARVLREVCSRVGDEILKHDLRVKQSHTSLYLFSRILNTAAGARKGGAFVFLPDSQRDAADYGIKISNRTTSLDIGADLTENWISYLQSLQQFGTPERESTMQLSEVLRAKLMTKTDAVGHFSHVDGCVVMTQEFKVLGFGAKIDAPVTLAEESPRRFKHIVSEEVYTDSVFMAAIGGTRHQSAARLCQIYPGMIVFTLSQDGDLKLFTSDEQFAYAYGPLDLPTIKDESMV